MLEYNLLTLSGSLRAKSSNAALLAAAAELAPEGVTLVPCTTLGALPLFNPDDDVEPAHPAVQAFRDQLRAADGIVLSSPEYAHGVPGALKNGLDWVVGSGELIDKPMLLWNASAGGGTIAQAQLLEILTTMSARVLVEASIMEAPARLLQDGRVVDPAVAARLRSSLETLAAAVRSRT